MMLPTAPDARWSLASDDHLRRHHGVFRSTPTTGRLSYVLNSQVTAASGAPLPYFPVPANPIDFTLCRQAIFLTLSGTPATGDSVFPYAYNSGNGQLTINQNSSQPLGMTPCNGNCGGQQRGLCARQRREHQSAPNGQIFAYSAESDGALQAEANGYYR